MTVFLIVLAVMVFVGCVLLVWSWCRAAALGDQVAVTPPDHWDGWSS